MDGARGRRSKHPPTSAGAGDQRGGARQPARWKRLRQHSADVPPDADRRDHALPCSSLSHAPHRVLDGLHSLCVPYQAARAVPPAPPHVRGREAWTGEPAVAAARLCCLCCSKRDVPARAGPRSRPPAGRWCAAAARPGRWRPCTSRAWATQWTCASSGRCRTRSAATWTAATTWRCRTAAWAPWSGRARRAAAPCMQSSMGRLLSQRLAGVRARCTLTQHVHRRRAGGLCMAVLPLSSRLRLCRPTIKVTCAWYPCVCHALEKNIPWPCRALRIFTRQSVCSRKRQPRCSARLGAWRHEELHACSLPAAR